MTRRRLWLVYCEPPYFSGQLEATRMIRRGLDPVCWDVREVILPGLDRNATGLLRYVRYAGGLFHGWMRGFSLLWRRRDVVYVNVGQSFPSFVRDSIPILFASAAGGGRRLVISLHGSYFVAWPDSSAAVRLFVRLLRRAAIVTVLGPRQRGRLLGLGLVDRSVRIVPNTCEVPSMAEETGLRPRSDAGPVRLLHLGNLIDSKGYVEFLESLALLAGNGNGPHIDAVLCGEVTLSRFSRRFFTVDAAQAWIEEKIATINRSTRVRVRWLDGASGAEKWRLFREASVFVFPSTYPVEAQPIVLLEAMASGCAIVASTAGEIGSLLDDSCAVFVEPVDAGNVASAIERLARDPASCGRLGEAGRRRFFEQFSPAHYAARWTSLLDELGFDARSADGRAAVVSSQEIDAR